MKVEPHVHSRTNRIHHKEDGVRTDRIMGRWFQLVGDIRHRWGKPVVDDGNKAQSDAERLICEMQERYGYARDPGLGLDEFATSVKINLIPKSRAARVSSVPIELLKNPENQGSPR